MLIEIFRLCGLRRTALASLARQIEKPPNPTLGSFLRTRGRRAEIAQSLLPNDTVRDVRRTAARSSPRPRSDFDGLGFCWQWTSEPLRIHSRSCDSPVDDRKLLSASSGASAWRRYRPLRAAAALRAVRRRSPRLEHTLEELGVLADHSARSRKARGAASARLLPSAPQARDQRRAEGLPTRMLGCRGQEQASQSPRRRRLRRSRRRLLRSRAFRRTSPPEESSGWLLRCLRDTRRRLRR